MPAYRLSGGRGRAWPTQSMVAKPCHGAHRSSEEISHAKQTTKREKKEKFLK